MNAWLALAAGSIAGGVSRYAVTSAVGRAHDSPFPFGTLTVNVVGCLLVGALSTAGGVRFSMPPEARLFLIAGFCGGFTTFSALILETAALSRAGAPGTAATYLGVSLALGFLAFFVGSWAGRLV